jgi:hypothetical protein
VPPTRVQVRNASTRKLGKVHLATEDHGWRLFPTGRVAPEAWPVENGAGVNCDRCIRRIDEPASRDKYSQRCQEQVETGKKCVRFAFEPHEGHSLGGGTRALVDVSGGGFPVGPRRRHR